MKLRIRASTGATILVWREQDTYCARRSGTAQPPEVCLGIDLFEVIADLAGLDLNRDEQATEAIQLAEYAQERLADGRRPGDGSDDASAESSKGSP